MGHRTNGTRFAPWRIVLQKTGERLFAHFFLCENKLRARIVNQMRHQFGRLGGENGRETQLMSQKEES